MIDADDDDERREGFRPHKFRPQVPTITTYVRMMHPAMRAGHVDEARFLPLYVKMSLPSLSLYRFIKKQKLQEQKESNGKGKNCFDIWIDRADIYNTLLLWRIRRRTLYMYLEL